ncbi:ATP phosphoribosyltransferase regulatory subunit [Siccirubricoccus deserti]|uniref:ATP phosphoribosyltransferase regulatory subunit n=1 Tax=Siccirubricoccus deserti TaxID=2013562 RepID=A0A9X0QY48_9PROT|nr:ATP phosphoribosyltransferase regulatory subunit [Siccirubricoccus deserti]MBC4016116.1 ATP phosphoribosyltransferase regulatory subunit [Siccirubricoccus deserti]GGC45916.1 ATP phosphoribosyltransferase regulatory subunit [Siccirubricoccus deserti]
MTDDAPNSSTPPGLLPAGLMDLLPPEAEREAVLVETLMAAFAGHGYERVKPPLLEFEDSLLAGSGAAVAEQTFRLMDPVSQRMMGLRADTTPQVARIAATRLGLQPRPLRLCYAGQVLRVRGTQLAPERQLPQTGIELIGSDAPAADAEVALVAAAALAAAGVPSVSLDITLPTMAPALLEAAEVPPALRQRLARALDRKDAASVAALSGEAGPLAAALPVLLAAAGPADGALAALAGVELPPAARAIADNAAAVIAAIRARAPGLRITLDPVEFRGFRYHVGVAFTLYGPGTTGELARGGRYMSLNEEPATGMSLYPDAVLRAAPAPAPRPRVFVPAGTPEAALQALRAQGFATVAALSAADSPKGLRCSHRLVDGRAVPISKEG